MVTQIGLEAAAFPDLQDAQAAVDELKSNGFDEDSISVIYTDTSHSGCGVCAWSSRTNWASGSRWAIIITEIPGKKNAIGATELAMR